MQDMTERGPRAQIKALRARMGEAIKRDRQVRLPGAGAVRRAPDARGHDVARADVTLQRHPVDGNAFTQYVSRGPGEMRDDRGVQPCQPVEQAGLADVGPAGQHDGHAVPEQGALPGAGP